MTQDTRRMLVTLTVTILTGLDLLNATIITIALPAMRDSFAINTDEITWVLTAFAVANAIFIPVASFLVKKYGQQQILLLCTAGFLLSSLACGFAENLNQMIIARCFQGAFGAGFLPISQLVLRQQYPPAQLSRAMAAWGMGLMVAPIMGPSLGGLITEYLTWHWIFYLNIPICVIALGCIWSFLPSNPLKPIKIDWLGFILMATGIGTLQFFLDRGDNLGWFTSPLISTMAISSVIFISIFIVRGIKRHEKNIINLHLFKEPVFLVSTSMMLLFTMSLFSVSALQPMQLQTLMDYSPKDSGLIVMARAIGSMSGMFMITRMHHKTEARNFVFFGALLAGVGTYFIALFDTNTSVFTMVSVLFMQGIGIGFFIPTLMSVAFIKLNKSQEPDAAGLYSFGRLLGISLGIALMSNLISHFTTLHWFRLKTFFNPFDFGLDNWLFHLDQQGHQTDTLMQTHQHLAEQAGMLAYQETYLLMAIINFAIIPLAFILPKSVKDPTGLN